MAEHSPEKDARVPHTHGGTDAPECTPYGVRCSPPADTRPAGKYLTVCPSCGETFGVNAKHMVRQRARCRPCVRVANGWTCRTCGSADPRHPSPCPISPAKSPGATS